MNNNGSLFLDTSIIIARAVHSPETKLRIEERLKPHPTLVSSHVVKQEFKRRLLGEAEYLLNLLNNKKSYAKVLRHLIDVLPVQQQRKRTICLEMLNVVFEDSDQDLTDRARRYLRQLLRNGIADFVDSIDYLVWESGCECSSYPVTEKVPYERYDLGPSKCSKVRSCGIGTFFLLYRAVESSEILKCLKATAHDKKSAEIRAAEAFLERVTAEPATVTSLDPCLTVGDLLIALESAEIETFYTMNGTESQHLCRALKQSMIVRPKNPEHEDRICLNSDTAWPESQ